MPQNYLYPGVYIEEVPSAVRTIAGVSTSNTAFVDFFKKGPVDEPVLITSYGDFERIFGGLDARSAASYAIQQYYLNGGSIAYVVRVASRDDNGASTAKPASVTPNAGNTGMAIEATSPGEWANGRFRITLSTDNPATIFNLVVEELDGSTPNPKTLYVEKYNNLSMDPANTRYAPPILKTSSQLVRINHTDLTKKDPPTQLTAPPAAGADGSELVATPANGSNGETLPDADIWKNSKGEVAIEGSENLKTGIYALDKIAPAIFNLLCLPAAVDLKSNDMQTLYSKALTYVENRRAFLILDVMPGTALSDYE